jgi:hypothetical protein
MSRKQVKSDDFQKFNERNDNPKDVSAHLLGLGVLMVGVSF